MFGRVRRIAADAAALAGLRIELFALELREQFERWLQVATLAMAAVVLGCIGLAFVAVLVTVVFWDSHPLVALGLFSLLFLGAAAWCARRLSALVAFGPPPFEATLAEFRKDRRALDPRAETTEPQDPAAGAPQAPAPPGGASR